MTEREQAQAMGLMRLGIGLALFAFPRLCTRVWLGPAADVESTSTRIAMRSLGGREIALGAGLLIALDRGTPARGWLEAGVVADSSDMISVIVAPGVPVLQRLVSLAGAGGAAFVGLRLADSIDA